MAKYLFLILALLTACDQPKKPPLVHLSGVAMTMEWRAQIKGPLKDPAEVERLIERSFREVNLVYNRWNPLSEISKINRQQAHLSTPISPQLQKFLAFTDEMVKLSGGRFDPTIEPLQTLWKSKLVRNEIPTDEEILDILPAVGWKHFQIENGHLTKDQELTSFDLGGIAKGMAVDMVVERLNQAGYSDVYFEWGGEIRATGKHPEGRPWTVFIARLKNSDPKDAIDLVALDNEAIATSGDYEQFWVVRHPDGTSTTYFHVIDPETGRPLTSREDGIASVSVVAPTCAIADALATTALSFPNLDEAEAFALKAQKVFPTARFWFVKR